ALCAAGLPRAARGLHRVVCPGWCRAAGCEDGRPRDGRERGGRRQTLPGLVPRYSVLEAVTWGALGALLLQLLRQIAWLRSLPDARREHRALRLPSQHTVVTEASTSCSTEQLGSCFLQKASPEVVPENASSGIPSGQGESQPWAEVGEFHIPESSSLGPVLHCAKGDPAQRGHLEEAAFQLQQIFRIDISIALNILGIESMRAGHYRIAYTCFKLAADRGYSKAQFNVGLCYEHGRGTEKDLEKAQAYLGVFYMRGLQPKEKRGLKYLLLAAKNGDAQSRYHVGVCYEKGLGVQQNLAEAMRHYQQSAAAGNRSAQERLRVLQEEVEGTMGSRGQGCVGLHGNMTRKSGACTARGRVAENHGKKESSAEGKGTISVHSSSYQLFPS
uniref:Uncharacterized protein n=1 Tax=Melopsittacus undulatus TaxID=13146 RepID=A0A8V5GE04_MELUD